MDKETQALEQCHAYFDGALSPEDEARFLILVKTDPVYRETYSKLDKVRTSLKQYVDVDPPSGLEERILSTVATEEQTINVVTLAPRKPFIKPVQVAAAVLLIALTGIVFYLKPWGQQSADPTEKIISSTPVDNSSVADPTLIQNPNTTTIKQPKNRTSEIAVNDPEQVKQPKATAESDALLEEQLAQAWLGIDDMENQVAIMEETDWIQPFNM
jgi:hypothetical protein